MENQMKKMKKNQKDYETTEVYAMVIAFIGYTILLIGIIYPIVTGMFRYRTPEVVVFTYFALVIIIGVSMIIMGQMIRALVDNTNANREILWILKAKQKDEGWEEEEEKERDEVTFIPGGHRLIHLKILY